MKKTICIAAALLCAGLFAQSQAEESRADSTLRVAALTPDSNAEWLPSGKREQMAAVPVPTSAPRVVKGAAPEFPELARRARIEGVVYARVLVDEKGQVAELGKVTGFAVFHEAVARAAQELEFAPAMQGDRAVKAWVSVPFSFEM